MTTLKITMKGLTPLIMHSCRCVNPLHPLSKRLKELTSIKKKTDEHLAMISDCEWLAGAYIMGEDITRPTNPLEDYLTDTMRLYVPGQNVLKALIEGAKAFKLGKNVEKFINVPALEIPLDIGDGRKLADVWRDFRYRDIRPMKVSKSMVLRTRPRFEKWAISFDLSVEETKFELSELPKVLEYAGRYVGLCDSRPRYGKFATVVEG